jgi:hypothetical protein
VFVFANQIELIQFAKIHSLDDNKRSRSWVADNAVCLLHAAVAFVCHMRGDAAKGGAGPSRIPYVEEFGRHRGLANSGKAPTRRFIGSKRTALMHGSPLALVNFITCRQFHVCVLSAHQYAP